MTAPFLIRGIPSAMVPRFWPLALPYIKRALDHSNGEFSANDIRQFCEGKDVQLWLASQGLRIVGAATTEIVVYPNATHCRVITIAGSQFDEWIPLMNETLARFAQEQGCVALEAYVRRGFVKKLATLGYKHTYSVVLKELPKEPILSSN